MFNRVLVANRGEIAVRIIRALHELGVEAVAVYSTADENALHVRLADRAVRIGPPPAAESYLNMPAVVTAATTTGCEAVHPGYGFLAENDEFVHACEDNDLVFIGPPADVMARMGDKAQAKVEMRAAGVPLVPGTDGTATPAEARAAADELGYPVLLKAAAGGGGRGMRLVTAPDELEEAYARASAEALAAFSDGTLYVEKAISPARHVEIQVLCDNSRRRAHVRRARVLDPAPAPEADRGVAVSRARRGAARGDGGGRGARVPAHRLPQRGHVRVPRRAGRRVLVHRAERAPAGRASGDRARHLPRPRARSRSGSPPASGSRSPAARRGPGTRSRSGSTPRIRPAASRPSPGRIEQFRAPLGPGVRVDTFVEDGTTVPPHYDSLIAKVIVRDETRDAAITRARRALRELDVRGVPTTRDAALDILGSDEFRSGEYSTSFLEEAGARLPALAAT